MTSRAWRRLLHTLLGAANAINAHRAPARPAAGFSLDSLPKFADMRCEACVAALRVGPG